MADKWITTKRERRSKKYKLLHEQLKREVQPFHRSFTSSPAEDKAERKRSKSQDFRAHGDAS